MGLLPPPLDSTPWGNVTGIGHGADCGQGYNYYPDTRSFWPLGQSVSNSESAKTCSSSTTSESASDDELDGGVALDRDWSDSISNCGSDGGVMLDDDSSESTSDSESVCSTSLESVFSEDSASVYSATSEDESQSDATSVSEVEAEATCFQPKEIKHEIVNGTTYYMYPQPQIEPACFYFPGAVQSESWYGTTYYSYSAPGLMCFYPL